MVAVLGFAESGFGGARSERQFIGMLSDARGDLRRREPVCAYGCSSPGGGARLRQRGHAEQEEEELDRGALKDLEETDDLDLEAEVLTPLDRLEPDSDQERCDPRAASSRSAEESRDIGLEIEAESSGSRRPRRTALSTPRGPTCATARAEPPAGLADFKALGRIAGGDGPCLGARRASRGVPGQAPPRPRAEPGRLQLYGGQALASPRDPCRTDRIRAAVEALAHAFLGMLAWRAGLGLILSAELGRHADAADRTRQVADGGSSWRPPSTLLAVTLLDHAARIAAAIGRRQCRAKP